MLKKRFPFYRQLDAMDCGPTCLRIVARYYGRQFPLIQLRQYCSITKQGVSFATLNEALGKLGFKTLPAEIELDVLIHKIAPPCILHWGKKHFVVLYSISKKEIGIADPAIGKVKYSREAFLKHWQLTPGATKGRAILLETTPAFYSQPILHYPSTGLLQLWQYLKPHKRKIAQTILTLLLGCVCTLVLPFLTQAIVDKGIAGKDRPLITLIVAAQLFLVAGRMVMDVVRARLLFRVGTQVSIAALSRFLAKLMRLPFPFFETRNIGDNIQRMQDNQKIEQFLTGSLINILLAAISILVFGAVLAYYSLAVFTVFLVGSSLIMGWVFLHTQRRKILDHTLFTYASANQSLLVETISAIQEIKLTNSESQKIKQFEQLQVSGYQAKLAGLKLDQRIQNGTQIGNELKNIITTYLAASQVISGQLSLGMMLSIVYIAGQLNTPILQFAEFVRTAQNADFSIKRMNDVYLEADEDTITDTMGWEHNGQQSLQLEKVSFGYAGANDALVFEDISLQIPAGKTTAIVGMSGSGKTTLIKLLLKFYQPLAGNIFLGSENYQHISAAALRKRCGVVMQDGFIFADTIANNIAIGNDAVNHDRLVYACRMANIFSFIEQLPFGFNTPIGKDGHGLSEGQIQRILIARLVYRNPDFIFLDEATNALDANNEKAIVENLDSFFIRKTVVVVAHRLSTVKNAHQIVVLEKGKIVEQGSHSYLIAQKGTYYHLIKNQLELGS